MTCPVCGGKTRIPETSAECDHVERIRLCLNCGLRFKTIEVEVDLFGKLTEPRERKERT